MVALVGLATLAAASAAPAAMRTRVSPPLGAMGQSLPAARSGQTYLWGLKVEGGTPPYHCVPESLGVGSIHLTSTCQLTGTAPVVKSESITGPFRFKVRDSSSPPKTAEFPSMNFTTVPEKLTANSFNGTYTGLGSSKVTTDCPAVGSSKAVHIVKSAKITRAVVANGTFLGKPIVVSGDSGTVKFSMVANFMPITWTATFAIGPGDVPMLTESSMGIGRIHGCTTTLTARFAGRRSSP